MVNKGKANVDRAEEYKDNIILSGCTAGVGYYDSTDFEVNNDRRDYNTFLIMMVNINKSDLLNYMKSLNHLQNSICKQVSMYE